MAAIVLALAPFAAGLATAPGATPAVLARAQDCGTEALSSGRDIVLPVRVVRPSIGGAAIVANVCLDGHGPFRFIVDTGASTTLVVPGVSAQLHLRPVLQVPVSGFGCTRTVPVARLSSLSVEGLNLAPQAVLVGAIRDPFVPGAAGVLGSDILGRFGAVRIDFAADQLTLAGPEGPSVHSAVGFGPPDVSNLARGTLTRIQAVTTANWLLASLKAGAPVSAVQVVVAVRVGSGPSGGFVVDTGALNTIISPPVAEQDHLAKVGEPTDGYAGLACPVRFTHYRVSAWRVVYKGRSLALEQFALAPQTVFSTGLSGVLPPGPMAFSERRPCCGTTRSLSITETVTSS